ncbi:MAG: RND family transporter [Candidatus Marinimicrobia bacterium]|nr:RND family transporter [Candidatus Neomarinimicrobiota bacterium]
MADKIIEYRWLIIIGFIVLTLAVGWQIPQAQIQADFETYIPEDVPARANTSAIEDIFGGSDILMILLETDDVLNPRTLQRVREISRQVNRMKGVEQVLSLFDSKDIRGDNGMMIVDPAVKRIPRTDLQRETLRKALRSNDLVYELIVSADFNMTAIIMTLEQDLDDQKIMDDIHAILDEVPGEEIVRVGGMPETHLALQRDIARDFAILMPIALILMIVSLFVTFHQLRGVLLPFCVVIMSTIFAMGFHVLLGWKLTILSILLPVMLIAIANDYGIHLVASYQELNAEGGQRSKSDLVKAVLNSLSMPILLTGLTTVAGILGLLSHVLLPAKQLGVSAAVGIAYALLLSLFFLPALMSFLRRPRPVLADQRHKRFQLERGLLFFGRVVAQYPRRIVSGAVVLTIIIANGIFFLEVDSNVINFFPKSHTTRQTADLINTHFGGSENLAVLISGDIKDPALLRRLDHYESELERLPDVGNVTSIATIIKAMSQALNDPGEAGYNQIPDTREAVAQYIELYNLSGDPGDFEKIVDFDYKKAQMIITMRNPDASAIKQVIKEVEKLTEGDRAVSRLGGQSLITAELSDIVVRGQMISLAAAILIITLMMMLLFHSVVAGILAAVPLVMAVIMLFGLMGYFGVRLDIATAMLSSIMIGVGVDYTIHFLWRYRRERLEGRNYGEAVIRTLTTTGRGISFNALSVIVGFSALILSLFPPIKFFGFLVVMSIFTCLIGALVLVPALCLIWKPRFLEPK